MKIKERNELYKLAVDKWGKREQLDMMQEEATELALACRKYIRDPEENRFNDFMEEIADVEIMIEQMKFMFSPSASALIEMQVNYKLNRLKKRIES